MNRLVQGAFWIGVYLFLSLIPLALILIGPTPPGRDFWTEFSVALGFVGLAMLGIQFGLTARFRRVAAPYGLDIMLRFHRQISLFAFAIVLAHPLILFAAHPEHLALLDLADAPWRARMGILAILGLVFLIAISLWRIPLGIPYEVWRVLHSALAVAVLAFALLHAIGVGYYLDLTWKRALWAGLAAGAIALLGYVRVFKPVRMLMRPYEVDEVIEERGDSRTVVLRPVGHEGMRFRPGQFAWLTLWHSPFSIEEHPFSLSSSAQDPERPAFTIKALGDFTSSIQYLTPGTRAYLDGPYGAFSVDRYGGDHNVYIGGGVGITPIMSMLRTLAERGDRRRHLLIYATKEWEGATFREELDELQEKLDLRVVYVLEEPPEEWEGEAGFVDAELLDRHLPEDRERAQYFICGPPPMLDAVDRGLNEQEVPVTNIHMERFNLV
ncbi:ferredoxin reductase family protein [soil metagenome]